MIKKIRRILLLVNVYKDEDVHPGFQPIRVLSQNIAHRFERVHPDIVKDFKTLRESGRLADNINYHINQNPLLLSGAQQTPYIVDGIITLHETFLAYLWSIAFYFHVYLYEHVHKRVEMAAGTSNHQMLSEASRLLEFAMKLRSTHAILDKRRFMNPELYCSSNEFYVTSTNSVYISALAFILSHEFGHAKEFLYGRTKRDEERADEIATMLLIEGSKDLNELANRAVGAVIALGSFLLLSNITNSTTHPDTDFRILKFLTKLPFDDNSEIWILALMIVEVWDRLYSVGLDYKMDDTTMLPRARFEQLLEQ